jgi:protein TonB
MDFGNRLHPIIKHITMTTREIMQASVLDIVFEHRNKDYGAYALRRDYDKRLVLSLALAFSLIGALALLPAFKKSEAAVVPVPEKKSTVVITEVRLRPEKPKEPVLEKARPKAAPKTAARQYTSQIKIKPDPDVKAVVPDMRDLDDKRVDTYNQDGPPAKGPEVPALPAVDGPGNGNGEAPAAPDFEARELQPEFPGGDDALRRFLAGQLQSPEQLESGERKLVKIRFVIRKDGSVGEPEILLSGGSAFDREVVRVMKKMPRWKPAVQNGIPVSVTYMLPVSFVGIE